MTPLFRKFLGLNWMLVVTVLGLLVFGVFAVYSASYFREGPDADLANKWREQIVWICLGLCGFIGAALFDYRWVRWACPIFYVFALVLLVYTLIVAEARSGGAHWIKIGGRTIQPSQLAIAAGILTSAVALSELQKIWPIFRYHFLRLSVSAIIVAVPMLLVLKQGDFGSAIVWAPTAAAMWLVGGIPFRYLISITLVVLTLLPLAFFFGMKDYQQKRITTYFDVLQGKEVDIQGDAWAIHHATMAIGSAGWDGKGFKASKVPGRRSITQLGLIAKNVAINDYIFAVVAEEHGFRGSLLLISALHLLLLQLLFVAHYSRDQLGRLIVVGSFAMLGAHIFQNIGMCLTLLPITGLPLPLISYGGTFMVVVLFMLGMCQSVWVHRNTPVLTRDPERAPV